MHSLIKRRGIISIVLVLLLSSTTFTACSKHISSGSSSDSSSHSSSSSSSEESSTTESSEGTNNGSAEEGTNEGFGGSLTNGFFGESSGFGNSNIPEDYWKFTYKYDSGNIDDTIYIIQKRLENYTSDGNIWIEGNDSIMVALPPVENVDKVTLAEALIADSNIYFIRQYSSDGKENYYFQSLDESGRASYSLNHTIEELIASGDVVVESKDIQKAEAQTKQNNFGTREFIVAITFNPEGSEKFAKATKAASINHETIAIMCNDTIISCPSVNGEITDGNVWLSGLYSYEEACIIATNLNSGNLPVKLTIDSIQ
ncbi:MAG: hypothetical protein MJZ11_08695 [Lachnospiraceae bacterium]|nr:hypothetical protein [Lachnospiraceae bacterium]